MENKILTNGTWLYYDITNEEVTITSAATPRLINAVVGEVVIPDTINGYPVVGIGVCAFEDTDIEKITLPEGVQFIEERAFAHCEKLQTVNFPYTLEIIEDEAFEGCEELMSLDFPRNLKCIGDCAFRFCDTIKSIKVPGHTRLGRGAFDNHVIIKKEN